MPDYGSQEYWEHRYEAERVKYGNKHSFEWYFGWDVLSTLVMNYTSEARGERILIVGCGNSNWAEQMYDAGYRNLTCVDWSRTVVGLMQTRYKRYEGLLFEQCDVRRMLQYGTGGFDLVIDKAVLDAVMCGIDGIRDADLMVNEVYRVLKPGGIYFCVTHGVEEMRRPTLSKAPLDWRVDCLKVPRHLHHKVFVCEKPEGGEELE